MKYPLFPATLVVLTPAIFAQSPDLFPKGVNRLDFETDGLFSGDIDVISSKLAFEQVRGSWNFSGSVGYTHHRVEYTPAFVTSAATRKEDSQAFDLQIEKTINPYLTLTGSLAYSHGYSDHRSIWISEFYDQSNSFDPAYREADPESFSGSVGLQWNYDPGKSFLSIAFSQADTTIVPGWETEVDELTGDASLFSTNDTLRTYSGTAIWNTVVNQRMRAQQTLRIGRTQSRRIRTQFQSELAYAVTNDLTLRLQLGGAHEDPAFISRYGGLGLVYELNSAWQVNLNYRYYEDTGEVNTSNFNTAAPEIATRELSAGIRWSNGTTSILGSVGLYETDYESVAGTGNVFFSGLYKDREFTAVRLAVSHSF